MPDARPETAPDPDPQTNEDDGAAGTLDLPRENDEGGDEAADPIPDA